MNNSFTLWKEMLGQNHDVFSSPSLNSERVGTYSKDHYIIFSEIIHNEQGVFGRMSDQSLFFANLEVTGFIQISNETTQFYSYKYGPLHFSV